MFLIQNQFLSLATFSKNPSAKNAFITDNNNAHAFASAAVEDKCLYGSFTPSMQIPSATVRVSFQILFEYVAPQFISARRTAELPFIWFHVLCMDVHWLCCPCSNWAVGNLMHFQTSQLTNQMVLLLMSSRQLFLLEVEVSYMSPVIWQNRSSNWSCWVFFIM